MTVSMASDSGGDGWREGGSHVGVEAEGDTLFVVLVGGAAVDDDVGDGTLGGEEGDRGGGIDGKGGA